MSPTLDAALRSMLCSGGTRPLVTYYDDATGERAELSVASLDNAVAKTANLLVDGLDVQPGERVRIDLPLHWQLPVWLGACWAVGAVAEVAAPGRAAEPEPEPAEDAPAVAVVGPGGWAAAAGARDVVAVSLLPFGMPFRDPLPPGVLDHAVESRAMGDVFTSAMPPGSGDPALRVPSGGVLTHGNVLDAAAALAARLGLDQGGRLLSTADPRGSDDALLAVLAVPLAVAGSVVLVRHAEGSSPHADAERVTAVLTDA